MGHNSEKNFFEYLTKNILLHYNIIEGIFIKSERPDFISENIGLEITRADQSLPFNGFKNKYLKNKIRDIKKFNKNFEKTGGRVLKKNSAIVRCLNLVDAFHYHKDYIYINPSYTNDFKIINKEINKKLNKLNTIYDNNIKNYYLGIYTTIYATEKTIQEEFIVLNEMQKDRIKRFDKIIIVFLDKICVFDLTSYKYKIIDKTNEELNKLSYKTIEELDNINNH